MNVFDLRRRVIDDYSSYVRSFISIRDPRIRDCVERELAGGLLWPDPRIALNPAFAPGAWIEDLVRDGVLHPECARIFRIKGEAHDRGRPMRLHQHQVDAVHAARANRNYVLTTGTGSGKSLAYVVPIVDHVLRSERRKGIKAIVVYPMNALANSQEHELTKFLCHGYPDGKGPVTFRIYTGQQKDEERQKILADPPDILLTNYVMLELILTRVQDHPLVAAARGLRFLVLDELHTYRGRQGADVALLVRRARDACVAIELQHIGTSATMATGGTFAEQRAEVARVASLIFGVPVEPGDVIGETLRRATLEPDLTSATFRDALRRRLTDAAAQPPTDMEAFVADPLSSWIESAFGLTTEAESGRLVRAMPRPITGREGGAAELARLTDVSEEDCATQIQRQLLAGYGLKQPETGFPVFAFRLHQFISRGDTVFSSLEPEEDRYSTVHRQKCVPEDRNRPLIPLSFCRECGQEYYCVRLVKDAAGERVEPRAFGERGPEVSGEKDGYLYVSAKDPWVYSADRLPEDWLEADGRRVKSHQKHLIPHEVRVTADGRVVPESAPEGLVAHFVEAPFRFCLRCEVAYGGHARSDFPKLGTLGSEGRSTATTILSLSAVRHLRRDEALIPETRKLLSFTDNRQDASLQAGHFNDFVEVGVLRSALVRAVELAGAEGISHEALTQRVFEALGLPLELYAADPGATGGVAKRETERALRDVLGYRLYYDLQKGWRITSPNLEQTGLLRIEYESLDELAASEERWKDCHAALAGATAETRVAVARVLLDLLRRALAIKVDYLDAEFQERLQQLSSQKLRAPWALDEGERLVHAYVAVPRSERARDYGGWVYLSARGGFGQYVGRRATFPHLPVPLSVEERATVIRQLLECLRTFGLVERVREPEGPDDVPGYQLPAAAMRWVAGDGTRVSHDPIRVPNPSIEGGRPNAFFLDFYRTIAADGRGLEAREHTAQVPYEAREDRETRFREGRLPILYCSPTMELGVDIASLNVVNMRNVPPTPANYAQRSGRAGRSGQPALVITYCSGGSPHDQYFFHHQERMVSGQVSPPRLDLANEDLVRAHIHAIWLAETHMRLGSSLTDVLDVSGEQPTLELQAPILGTIEDPGSRERAKRRAAGVLATLSLEGATWWSPTWLDDVFQTVGRRFETACDRWRTLYRAARAQFDLQNRVIADAARSPRDKDEARKLRREAEAQLGLLTAEDEHVIQSDFYSYRYFASEGFLPGYSFPRLPLSAFIPGRVKGSEEFLSRPRFIAISEFGPQNFIYHEGSRYVVSRVILPIADVADPAAGITTAAKVCGACGYLHPLTDPAGPDRCESCGAELEAPIRELFRLQNVTTKRRDRISSDEEERQRQGYTIRSSMRFAEADGRVARQTATIKSGERSLATLSYGQAATIWRINTGWSRRTGDSPAGFVLDIERGRWEPAPDEDQEELQGRRLRVIPFVEDHKNCLLFQPSEAMSKELMASLQAALKTAIQVEFQLEDSELAAEPLPSVGDRRQVLFYEAAEGGAGVLRRLVEDGRAMERVARCALDLCHFDPETGADRGKPPWRAEPCSAACYDCLMSYTNQPDHKLVDRLLVGRVLLDLTRAQVAIAPGALTRDEQLERLDRLCGSELERRWLQFLMERGYRLPTDAQRLVVAAGTRPDFTYADQCLAVYVDGPPHDYPERRARDAQSQQAMEDLGYVIVRFHHQDDWEAILKQYPSVFGSPS